MSTWTIKEASSDKELGTIENKLRFVGSKITANGAFGKYTIEGNFGNHEFTIKKEGKKVRNNVLLNSASIDCVLLNRKIKLVSRLNKARHLFHGHGSSQGLGTAC